MGLDNSNSMLGMSRNTVNSEQIMLFASTMPRSNPKPNCINMSATSPDTVVSELDDISGMALVKALAMARRASFGSLSFSSVNL